MISLICDNSVTTQQCHNTSVNTGVTTQVSQHNTSVTTQHCHNTTLTTQHCHNTTVSQQNLWFFKRKVLRVLKCYNFLWVQRRHNCYPATSFANCVMTLYLLKVHLNTFLSIPITQKYQILSCDTLVANERIVSLRGTLWQSNGGNCVTRRFFTWLPYRWLSRIMRWSRHVARTEKNRSAHRIYST